MTTIRSFRKLALRVGVALFATALALLVSGFVLMRVDVLGLRLEVNDPVARSIAYWAHVLAPLLAHADSVVVTSVDPTRSADSSDVAADLIAHGFAPSRIRAIGDPREALSYTRGALADDDLLCIAGSMYMAGLARDALLDVAP